MTKKKDTAHQRLLSSVRKALTATHAVTPMPRYNAKTAAIDKARKLSRAGDPTPEQLAKVPYVEADISVYVGEKKVRVGHAYRRQPRFETISDLTVPQIFALRAYRRAFDVSELSPVKSALDVGPGGGSRGAEAALSRVEAVAFADVDLRRIEARIPPHLLATLRAVALHDRDFKDVAVERFASASGKRRSRVRDEFQRGVEALIERPAPARPAEPAGSALPQTSPVNPAFLDERGLMRPLKEIAEILLGGSHPDDNVA